MRLLLVNLMILISCLKCFNSSMANETSFSETSNFDSFYDSTVDYSEFRGRVTDVRKHIIKVKSLNKNVKFFRAGDSLRFKVVNKSKKYCNGFLRSVDGNYFVLFVKDLSPCWSYGEFFRRGTQLEFNASSLAERVKSASTYRVVLLKRRKDFLKQLNDLNHFIWNFENKKVLIAAEYDNKIVKLKKEKQSKVSELLERKKEGLELQQELISRLDSLQNDLGFYRVENISEKLDRWSMDQDLGLPVGNRPMPIKKK